MELMLSELTLKDALEICSWKYEGEYSIYNYPKWDIVESQKWAIAVNEKRKSQFLSVVDENSKLCGYIRFIENNDNVVVGLGLNPSFCGQGLGYKLMNLIKKENKKRYNKDIILEVRDFNKRAIKLYKNSGFEIIDTYEKDTLIGKSKFLKMKFDCNLL